jgi:hypothetical protein
MDIKEIESAVARLPPSELAKFAEWFEEFRARAWDERIEQDLKSGRLDELIKEAEREFESGRCEPL